MSGCLCQHFGQMFRRFFEVPALIGLPGGRDAGLEGAWGGIREDLLIDKGLGDVAFFRSTSMRAEIVSYFRRVMTSYRPMSSSAPV